MQERRTTIRARYSSRAQYCSAEDLLPRDGRVTNLSERGAGVLARERRPVGERVTVTFPLPEEEEPLTVTGVVRWSEGQARGRGYPMGLEWLPLEETTSHRLHAFLNAQAREAPRRAEVGVWRSLRSVRSLAVGVGIVLAILLGLRLFRGATALQQENRQLGGAVAQRNEIIQQLELRGAGLEQELTASNTQLATSKVQLTAAAEAMTQLGRQSQGLEGDVQRLGQEVERFQQSYVQLQESYGQLREEREALMLRVLDLQQERTLLAKRLSSIPDLRRAIRDAIQARTEAQRQVWLQARLAAAAREQSVEGNRGYLVWEGQPTAGRSALSIKVHEPETLPSTP